VRHVLDQPVEKVGRQVYNVGRSGENYRKLDLVEEIRRLTPNGEVSYVKRNEDPRDYKVSFDKIAGELGFATTMTVPDGIAEIISSLEAGAFGDAFSRHYRNTD
jgi:nucleoside-diphosphate-sugar epimerase